MVHKWNIFPSVYVAYSYNVLITSFFKVQSEWQKRGTKKVMSVIPGIFPTWGTYIKIGSPSAECKRNALHRPVLRVPGGPRCSLRLSLPCWALGERSSPGIFNIIIWFAPLILNFFYSLSMLNKTLLWRFFRRIWALFFQTFSEKFTGREKGWPNSCP